MSHLALVRFNADKCVVLWLNPRQAKHSNVQYQLNGELFRFLSHQSDLGATVDETLKTHLHCANAAKSESRKGIINGSHASTFPLIILSVHLPPLQILEERVRLINLGSLSCSIDMGIKGNACS